MLTLIELSILCKHVKYTTKSKLIRYSFEKKVIKNKKERSFNHQNSISSELDTYDRLTRKHQASKE